MVAGLSKRIQLVQGDITRVEADAIVTAANSALCGGGGVDGAVHDAAGPNLVNASMALAPCPAGEARITDGFKSAARYVVHAVGPIFRDLSVDGPTLSAAYESSLSLAEEYVINRIAFPCISTGVYGFPQVEACEIATSVVTRWLGEHHYPKTVIFCCFESSDFAHYEAKLDAMGLLFWSPPKS